MNTENKEKIAEILLSIKAITFNATSPYVYASGIKSPVYTDCRLLMGYPDLRKKVIDAYIEAMKKTGENFDVIAATATAGIPHGAWIAQVLNLPMIYVRGKAKDHGKENLIEGIIHKGQKAAVIEDLVSTGESSVKTVLAVKAAGGMCDHVFSIITYTMKEAQENFQKNAISLISLTDFPTVVAVASNLNYIKKEEKQVILDWVADPVSWGK